MNQEYIIPIKSDINRLLESDDIVHHEKLDKNFCCITTGVCMFIVGIPIVLSYIFYLSS